MNESSIPGVKSYMQDRAERGAWSPLAKEMLGLLVQRGVSVGEAREAVQELGVLIEMETDGVRLGQGR